MSKYSGKMGKGYARILKAIKREEAEERNERYQDEVSRVMVEHRTSAATAKYIVQAVRQVERAKAARRADSTKESESVHIGN